MAEAYQKTRREARRGDGEQEPLSQFDLLNKLVDGNHLAGLPAIAARILIVLFRHRNKKGWCWPSNRLLCERTGAGSSAVCRAMKELERRGLVKTKRKSQAGGRSLSARRMLLVPETSSDSHDVKTSSKSNQKHRLIRTKTSSDLNPKHRAKQTNEQIRKRTSNKKANSKRALPVVPSELPSQRKTDLQNELAFLLKRGVHPSATTHLASDSARRFKIRRAWLREHVTEMEAKDWGSIKDPAAYLAVLCRKPGNIDELIESSGFNNDFGGGRLSVPAHTDEPTVDYEPEPEATEEECRRAKQQEQRDDAREHEHELWTGSLRTTRRKQRSANGVGRTRMTRRSAKTRNG